MLAALRRPNSLRYEEERTFFLRILVSTCQDRQYLVPVSYTHLDVYKRQVIYRAYKKKR